MLKSMLAQTQFLTLTDDNFQTEVEHSPIPVVVDVWANWCMPQHRIDPIFHHLVTEFGDRIQIGCLNLATADRIGVKYRIRAVPTLLIFSQGTVVYRTIGAAPQIEIVRQLNAQLLNSQLHLIDSSRSVIVSS